MKIIIVGCGNVGSTLAEHLSSEGHDISIIDENAQKVETCSNSFDILGVIGNGASYQTQIEAGIEMADFLISVTGSDEVNLLCCLIAKRAGHCRTIARVRNPVYNHEISFIKEELGLSMVINPELAAAAEIADLIRFPSAIEIDSFSKGHIELLKFKLPASSPICNCSVRDLSAKYHAEILVCVVERNDTVTIPDGDFILQENDLISIIGSHKNTNIFFKKIGIITSHIKNTMIVGGDSICYYLASFLLKMGIDVKIIEQNQQRCEELSHLLPKARIICGNGTERDLLMEEGLEGADAFVTLTNYDEVNIMLSLFGNSISNAKIITKIHRISYDEIIQNLDLGSTIYPKFITAEYIIQAIRASQNSIGSNVETLYRLINNRVEALEFLVQKDAPLLEIPLQELNLKSNLLVCCIYRNNSPILPGGQDCILAGDRVIVVTTNTGLKDIKDILK